MQITVSKYQSTQLSNNERVPSPHNSPSTSLSSIAAYLLPHFYRGESNYYLSPSVVWSYEKLTIHTYLLRYIQSTMLNQHQRLQFQYQFYLSISQILIRSRFFLTLLPRKCIYLFTHCFLIRPHNSKGFDNDHRTTLFIPECVSISLVIYSSQWDCFSYSGLYGLPDSPTFS